MAADGKKKMTQAELLEILSPPPFNQRRTVPEDAVIEHSPESRWWRSDSPRLGDDPHADRAPEYQSDPTLSSTAGSIGYGKREGPGNFQTSSQTGSGSAAHFKNHPDAPPTISGFSGHYPGKDGQNCIGGTFDVQLKESLASTIALGK
eukprot:TRINITY_DN11167_c0_g1_i1.p1 TRINITY_DN11167_c0_g1~~TRINITY_DN11167_c0_g1_i1.p1  ORF type:complete len:171 (-),score=34.42 TRINITY_DN11167_c0_g1_i1:45-488(-)